MGFEPTHDFSSSGLVDRPLIATWVSYRIIGTIVATNALILTIYMVCLKEYVNLSLGGGDGNRTHNGYSPTDFKSVAFTYLATPPY